jgi:hypothetical protein
MMPEYVLPMAAFAGQVWDAARLLDAEYTGDQSKPPWAELSEAHKVEFLARSEHLVNPILTAYASTGSLDG